MDPLVHRARNGDKSAFESLYRQHVGRVYALCLRLSADPVRAEELTQDVFVRVWEKLRSFRGASAFTSWLHRLTVNVVLASERSRRRRAKWLSTMEDVTSVGVPAGASDPAGEIDLEAAIAALPRGARTVFVLHDIEGFEHGEIAKMAGIAPGTSKAQLHRARKLLREMLRE